MNKYVLSLKEETTQQPFKWPASSKHLTLD